MLGVSLQNLGTELETNLGLCSHTSLGIHWDHFVAICSRTSNQRPKHCAHFWFFGSSKSGTHVFS